ncbi:MAG: glycosyltransferase family 2 protein [Maricaulaceae bacterium]
MTHDDDGAALRASRRPERPSKLAHDVMALAKTAKLVKLSESSRGRDDAATDLKPIVVCVAKNERPMIGPFLHHYRSLGVDRFVFIDNGSSDGTAETLAAQTDVELWRTLDRFHWRAKQGWINRVMKSFSVDQWFLYVDADELLVFDQAGERSLPDLVAVLDEAGLDRARGLLVDMYAPGPLLSTPPLDACRPWRQFGYFDAEGYDESRLAYLESCIGGPRRRIFGARTPAFKPQLTKYPLFKLSADAVFENPHHIWPYRKNFGAPRHLALLHFKFHYDAISTIGAKVAAGDYWNESFEYKCYAECLADDPALEMTYSRSRLYQSPQDLVDAGLIAPVCWPHRTVRAPFWAAVFERRADRLVAAYDDGGEPAARAVRSIALRPLIDGYPHSAQSLEPPQSQDSTGKPSAVNATSNTGSAALRIRPKRT